MSSNISELEVIKLNHNLIKADSISVKLSKFFDSLHIKSTDYNGMVYEITLARDNHWIHLDRHGRSRAANTAPYKHMIDAIPGYLLPAISTYVYIFTNNHDPSDNELATEKFRNIISHVVANPVEDAFQSLLVALKSDVDK